MKDTKSPFTIRGLFIGAIMSVFVGVVAPYGMIMVRAAEWGSHASQLGGVFLFFVFTFLINTLLGLIRRPLALNRAELVLIYVMMLVALTVPTQNLLVYVIPTICVPFYSASPENNWASFIHPYLPEWIAPKDLDSIRHLYEGLPAGQSIPWEAWLVPFVAWFSFIIALSAMMFCLCAILHRQWSTNERLAYPMVQLPQQMIELGDDPLARVAPFFHSPVVWLGFALPFTLWSLTGLNHYFPSVPEWPYGFGGFELFKGLHGVILTLSFSWVGFFFLVDHRIVFSVWFFYLFTKLEDGLLTTLGIAGDEVLSVYEFYNTPAVNHQSVGAILVFVLFGLWVGRGHLRLVWEKAWHPDRDRDGVDAEELLPYRAALGGFLISLAFLAIWLWQSGVPGAALPFFLLLVLVYYVALTRVTAAGGIPSARPPIVAPYAVISGMGSSMLGSKGMVALNMAMGWQGEMRLFPMIACANGLKLAEMVKGPKGRLFWGMLLAVTCSLAGGTWILLTLGYEHGGINLLSNFLSNGSSWHFLDPMLQSQPQMNVRGWIFTGIGGAMEGFLMWANHRWFWWPLHPLGLVVCVGYLASHVWFSAFVAWLLKLCILKYGGGSLFTNVKPFFLGLIMGEATCSGVWLAIDYMTGTVGNRLGFM